MMIRASGARAHREAPALRFLLFCLGGWALLRVIATWGAGAPPPMRPPASWGLPPVAVSAEVGDVPILASAIPARRWERPGPSHRKSVHRPPVAADTGGSVRHMMRLALLDRLLAPIAATRPVAALPPSSAHWRLPTRADTAAPAAGAPYWMRRDLAGWQASGWVYLRPRGGRAPDGIAAAGQIGGSQAGLRIARGLAANGRLRAYGRATLALGRPRERDVAFGAAFAPFAGVPVDVAIEQRIAAGPGGRTALAAMVAGGVGGVALPAGFRLEAYGQAGVVGTHRRDGFADGAVVVDRRIGPREVSPLRLGALAAGAVQPGAARVDVGPRLTLRLPDVGQGGRIALDWRQRVAGDALPESGVAVTLAADF